MKKILITGGAGFVGRHFVKRFLESGHEVHCVDSIVPTTGGIDPTIGRGWPFFDPRDFGNFHFYKEDCRTYFERKKDDDFNYVLHLAAVVGGRLTIENRPLAVADDLSIDSHYWQWAVEAKPQKTVCFSSSAAYPIKWQREQGYKLLTEDLIEFGGDIGQPDMTYGWAKLTCEYLARIAHQKYGLRSVCYRPFSGYGEDQADEYPFPSICKRAIENYGKSTLHVWGSGKQMRDFIYIEDCVDGVLKTMDKIDNGDALNLSTGIYTSFASLAATAASLLGYRPDVIGEVSQPSGVHARAGDITKQSQFGFKASTSIEHGISRALEYFQKSASPAIRKRSA